MLQVILGGGVDIKTGGSPKSLLQALTQLQRECVPFGTFKNDIKKDSQPQPHRVILNKCSGGELAGGQSCCLSFPFKVCILMTKGGFKINPLLPL